MKRLNKSQMYLLEKGEFTCCDLQKLVGDYFDRELPRALQTRVQEHIESCPDCVQFAGSYKLIIELAREIGLDRGPAAIAVEQSSEMPSGVRNRLFAHLNKTLGLELQG